VKVWVVTRLNEVVGVFASFAQVRTIFPASDWQEVRADIYVSILYALEACEFSVWTDREVFGSDWVAGEALTLPDIDG
jgi:hypothetical protein